MFWLDAHILRASSSTVWACTSKRPAIDRISCGSVIKRVGISVLLTGTHSETAVAVTQRTNTSSSHHLACGACPLVGRYTMAGVYPGGACPFVGNPAGTGYAAAGGD